MNDLSGVQEARATGLPTIVTVIEAGPLEKQVLLLAESIRLWGGRLSKANIVAIQPRPGPGLSQRTKSALKRLHVEYLRISRDDGCNWFPYLNKTAAVKHVAAQNPGCLLIWLDADVLVVNEPSELIIDGFEFKFSACASNKNIGTAADDDKFAPYFKAACSALGVDYDSLPYIETEEERIPIRAYWNSGIYSFSADSGLAQLHHEFTYQLVKKGIGSWESKLFFSDQIALGLAAHHLALPYKRLSLSHNFSLQPKTITSRLARAQDACLLHYHACLWQPTFENFCTGLQPLNSDIAIWLRSQGPLSVDLTLPARAYRKVINLHRSRRYNAVSRRATLY